MFLHSSAVSLLLLAATNTAPAAAPGGRADFNYDESKVRPYTLPAWRHAARWEVETVIARGYATATFHCAELCEDRSEGLTKDVAALFGTGSVEGRKSDA